MMAYKVTPRLSVQVNVLNLFDKFYYDAVYYTSASENHAIPGPGRTVRVTLRASF
jgi:outer membrane receptor protein involved in Fe transport